MSRVVLTIEDVSKQYRLGTIGTGTLSHDLNRWWHTMKGKEDPYAKIGAVNNRAEASGSDYVWALKDINLDIHDGDVVGIIGKNGAGKSTLLKLLSQVTNPTSGQIKVKGRIASLLEVGTGFHPELTGRENIYLNGAILGMSKAEITSKLDEIVDFAGVASYIETPVKRYSSGMMVRLGFAVAAHLEPEILVVDEVLAVGDAEFQKKCIGKMKDVSEQGRTVLFVSHNMNSIQNLCSRGIVLTDGQISFDGGTEDSIAEYLSNNSFSLQSKREFDLTKISNGLSSISMESEVVETSENPIEINAVLKIKVSVPDMYLGIRITDKSDNEVLFSSTDEVEDDSLRSIEIGSYEIKCTVPKQIFKPGKYSVSFVLRGTGGERFHKVEDAITFRVVDTITYRGIKGRYRPKSVVGPPVHFSKTRID